MASPCERPAQSYFRAIALLCGLALPLALSSNLALAQEGELVKPIRGIISLEDINRGIIAYKDKAQDSAKGSPPQVTKLDIQRFPVKKYRFSASVYSLWLAPDRLIWVNEEDKPLKGVYAEGIAQPILPGNVKGLHGFTENSAIAYKDGKYYMIEAKDGELTVRDTDYTYKVPSAKEAYYDKFKLCESFGKMFDFKLSSKSKVVCADSPASIITKRYSTEKTGLVELPEFKKPIDWGYFQKNYFIDAMNSPNGGYYLKDGILYAPLYREGREVWEPLTDKPTEAFTPISGMKVKGGAILKDAVYSDRGVCGRDGYSQAFWLKTSKGEQLLHINTPESFWLLIGVSPSGCKVAFWDFTRDYPSCEGVSGVLSAIDVCSLQ